MRGYAARLEHVDRRPLVDRADAERRLHESDRRRQVALQLPAVQPAERREVRAELGLLTAGAVQRGCGQTSGTTSSDGSHDIARTALHTCMHVRTTASFSGYIPNEQDLSQHMKGSPPSCVCMFQRQPSNMTTYFYWAATTQRPTFYGQRPRDDLLLPESDHAMTYFCWAATTAVGRSAGRTPETVTSSMRRQRGGCRDRGEPRPAPPSHWTARGGTQTARGGTQSARGGTQTARGGTQHDPLDDRTSSTLHTNVKINNGSDPYEVRIYMRKYCSQAYYNKRFCGSMRSAHLGNTLYLHLAIDVQFSRVMWYTINL